jgi:hypothetical protein
MTTAFVLGNGVSRRGVPLDNLQQLGTIYGCNALYRDFTPDVLIATDRPISTFIQESGYSQAHKFYTRRPINNLGAFPVPKEYYGYSSGPIAIGLAAVDQHQRIYMVGFDMGPNNSKFNNVYASTEFYKKSDAQPTYTGNWVKQVRQIAVDFPRTQFIRVVGKTTATIPEFSTIKNIEHMPLDTFLDRINNQKDL